MSPRRLLTLALFCALCGPTHAVRPGDLDPTFAAGGTLRIPIPRGGANDVLVLPDGSIVVAGTGDPENDGTTKFVLAHVDAAGGLVSGFGAGGLVSTRLPFADTASARRLALDPDGRIVAAGVSTTELANGDTGRLIQMARYFPDGQLDRDFGREGIQGAAVGRDVAGLDVAQDRSIVFVGRDDDLVGGIVLPGATVGSFQLGENSSGRDVVPHAGGVVMGGSIGRDFLLMRFHAGLAPDTEFGDNGTVRTSLDDIDSDLRKLLVQPDGRIIAIGSTTVAIGDTDIAIVRYEADGALDPTFGDGGRVITSLGAFRDDAIDAALAPDGTMLVGGRTCVTAGQCSGFVVRLLADGRLDPDFPAFTPPGNVGAVAMPDDGHVLAVEQVLGELVVSRLVVAECGNGRLEAGEACDDGNGAAGDCCSPTCSLEPDDTPCADDGSACTADACRAGTCTHAVPLEAGCLAATSSTLTRVDDPATGERLRWQWLSTTPVDAASFGDPTATTDLSLCVVDGAAESERPLVETAVPAGGTCNGVPCWKQTRRGFRLKNAGAAEGVTLLRLVTGAEGSRVDLKARNLAGTSDLPVPVKVRLVRHDASKCFEAVLAPARGTSLQLQ